MIFDSSLPLTCQEVAVPNVPISNMPMAQESPSSSSATWRRHWYIAKNDLMGWWKMHWKSYRMSVTSKLVQLVLAFVCSNPLVFWKITLLPRIINEVEINHPKWKETNIGGTIELWHLIFAASSRLVLGCGIFWFPSCPKREIENEFWSISKWCEDPESFDIARRSWENNLCIAYKVTVMKKSVWKSIKPR